MSNMDIAASAHFSRNRVRAALLRPVRALWNPRIGLLALLIGCSTSATATWCNDFICITTYSGIGSCYFCANVVCDTFALPGQQGGESCEEVYYIAEQFQTCNLNQPPCVY